MDQPVRKRGRPQITKEYTNPLESPMAHSSMKVQKLGASSFSRPMMKVGQVNPSPRIRRTSSSSGAAGSETPLSGPGSTAKGRYRGKLLTTPTKRPTVNRSCTPSSVSSSSDSIFHSSSKMSLKSSPPVAAYDCSEDKVQDEDFQQFKFSLTIGENGRASIAGSSPQTSPIKENAKVRKPEVTTGASQTTISTSEKSRVLSLLKQMRNSTVSQKKGLAPEVQDESFKSNNETSMSMSMSSIIKSPQPPSTPRTSFAMRTGFTPNTSVDQVLLDIVSTPKAGLYSGNEGHLMNLGLPSNVVTFSPKNRIPLRKNQEGKVLQDKLEAQRQQYVFKFSSADPLLLTDDVEGNWAEVIYNQSQGSPKHHLCFNTPPSWVNWGSPRAFSPQRQDSNTVFISACQGSAVDRSRFNRTHPQDNNFSVNSSPCRETTSARARLSLNNADKILGEPSTPKTHDATITSAVGYTPLIQQTMNGSLTAKYIPGLLAKSPSGNTMTDQIKSVPIGSEQEDARVALKRLVADR